MACCQWCLHVYHCQKNQKLLHYAAFYYLLYAEVNDHPGTSKVLTALCITSDSKHWCQPQVINSHESDLHSASTKQRILHVENNNNKTIGKERTAWVLHSAIVRIKLFTLDVLIYLLEFRSWNFAETVSLYSNTNMRADSSVQGISWNLGRSPNISI